MTETAERLSGVHAVLDRLVADADVGVATLTATVAVTNPTTAADAIGHALAEIFALKGRHRPYYGYLERELRTHPLQTFPLAADELLAVIGAIVESAGAATPQRLLGVLEVLGRRAGCDEVIDEWWDDLAWMES